MAILIAVRRHLFTLSIEVLVKSVWDHRMSKSEGGTGQSVGSFRLDICVVPVFLRPILSTPTRSQIKFFHVVSSYIRRFWIFLSTCNLVLGSMITFLTHQSRLAATRCRWCAGTELCLSSWPLQRSLNHAMLDAVSLKCQPVCYALAGTRHE